MPRVRLPLAGGYDLQDDEYSSPHASRVINLVVDPSGTNRSRPGLGSFATAAPTSLGNVSTTVTGTSRPRIIGLAEHRQRIIAIDENRRGYAFDRDGNGVDITEAALPGKAPPRFLVDDDGRLLVFGGGAPRVVGSDYRMRTFLSADSEVPQATHGVIIDRFLVVNDSSSDRVYYAPVDDHTLIGPSSFLRAGSRSDTAVALAECNGQLHVFGSDSIEIWYGTGIGADPFRMERALPTEFGVGAARSVVKADNSLWWIDRERRVMRLDGPSPRMMSLPIDRQLQAMTSVDDCIGQRVQMGGKHLVTWTFKAARTTLVYDLVSNAWAEWKTWDGLGWSAMPLEAYAHHRDWNRHFCGKMAESGKVLELSFSTYKDEGEPIRRIRTMPFVDHGTLSPKFNGCVEFVLDGGVAVDFDTDEQTGAPTLELRWRDQDRRWHGPRRLPLGQIGDRAVIRPSNALGRYLRRQLEWEYSGPTAFSLAAIEEDFKPGV